MNQKFQETKINQLNKILIHDHMIEQIDVKDLEQKSFFVNIKN